MWLLHSLGKTYGQRPSEILGIEDEWAAYQLDVCALTVGCEVEAALAKGEDVEAALGQGAGVRGQESGSKGQEMEWRDARPFVKAKIKVPESGVW